MNKKTFGLREMIILAILLLSCYTIWPSIQIHSKFGEEKKTFLKENPKLAAKSINFGLDLAGGTSITLEIDKTGLKDDDISDIQQQSLEIVRNRVDQYGLSEPQIAPSGNSRIIVELAGVDDSTAKELVGSTAKLEFKILAEAEKFSQVVTLIDNYLSRQTTDAAEEKAVASKDSTAVSDTTAAVAPAAEVAVSDEDLLKGIAPTTATTKAADSVKDTTNKVIATNIPDATPLSSYYLSFGNGGFIGQDNIEKVKQILALETVQKLIPRDVVFAWGSGLEKISKDSNIKAKRFYLLKRRAEMNGEDISDARPYRVGDGTNAGEVAVSLKFSGVGPKKFSAVTAANVGKQMAIVLDDQVISAPVIRDRIPNGEAQITGLDDMAEANRLAVVLRAGALKAPMNIIESRNIGATLGVENIKAGFGSGVIGLILCLFFMISYYRFGGFVASLAVICNSLISAAVLSVFNATLTLPGVAGFILVLGMALDANVLIYERVRDEMKNGLMARAAVAKGYEKAFSAIFDSNLTTFLTALILYKIGSGPVKGFGLTLMIGMASSLFCSLTITRAILDFKLSKRDSNKLSIGKGIRAINEVNLSIIPKSKLFISISIVFVVISIGSMLVKGFDFSIDFMGGHVYTVQYDDNLKHEQDLTNLLTEAGVKDVKVRQLGGTSANSYQINLRKMDNENFKNQLSSLLEKQTSKGVIVASDTVGPTIGKELRFNAILSIILSWIAICLYIWFRFGKMGLGFGFGTLVGLLHDTVITVGFVSLAGLSVDGTLIASILTMIGYSVNDTIVVFDRIRENTGINGRAHFAKTVNRSINECFSRTIITSVTTFFVCAVIAFMGGSSIRDFGLVMVFGIIVGTYSSIAVSSPFVVWWSKRFKGGL
jgi:SecD/SecF fusion protein